MQRFSFKNPFISHSSLQTNNLSNISKILFNKMGASVNVDPELNHKKMEGDDFVKTVEGLRGRLLAERVSSRAANDEAQLMGNKLIELENQLKIETKLKIKAEKKLRFLKKKLESLNICPVSDESEQSISSGLSSAVSDLDEHKSPISQENLNKNTSSPIHRFSSGSANSVSGTNLDPNHEDPPLDFVSDYVIEDLKPDYQSNSSLQSSKFETEINVEINRYSEDYVVDDSLALVLVTPPRATVQSHEPKVMNLSVMEALGAMRHAREKLEGSIMERRRIINVG